MTNNPNNLESMIDSLRSQDEIDESTEFEILEDSEDSRSELEKIIDSIPAVVRTEEKELIPESVRFISTDNMGRFAIRDHADKLKIARVNFQCKVQGKVSGNVNIEQRSLYFAVKDDYSRYWLVGQPANGTGFMDYNKDSLTANIFWDVQKRMFGGGEKAKALWQRLLKQALSRPQRIKTIEPQTAKLNPAEAYDLSAVDNEETESTPATIESLDS